MPEIVQLAVVIFRGPQKTGAPWGAAPRGSVLEFRDQVQEDTIIVKAQIGQIVGEVGEVIADTDFGIVSVSYTHLTLPTIYSV